VSDLISVICLVVPRARRPHLIGMRIRPLLEIVCLALGGAAAAVPACTTTDTSACATDANGNYVCTDYVSAYPYDYAYVDPLYIDAGGYYPYTVDTYYDPLGYDYYIYALAHLAGPTSAASTQVPELLDRTHRAANAINYGVRAALDPIKDLIKSAPIQTDNTMTFGPADHGHGNYRFTMRQLSRNDKRYAWKLEGRPSGATGDFALVAGGTIKVGDADRRGTGALGIDCNELAAADSAITCQGQLLIGFSQPGGDKILNVVLRGYTVDPALAAPMDANVAAWRIDDNANHIRIATRANLASSATDAAETMIIKLSWLKDAGARADAVITDGDVPSGQAIFINSCVGASLSAADVMTTSRQCASDGSGCTAPTGGTLSCPSGLTTVDEPDLDLTVSDPPTGAPAMPAAPTSIPDGSR
jgi:hypothetical protein